MRVLPLREVAKVVTGNTPPKKDPSNYGEDVPLVRPGDLRGEEPVETSEVYLSEKGAALARIVPPRSVLVCCIGSVGKIGIAANSVAINQQINACTFNELVLPEYGFYALQSKAEELQKIAAKAVVPIINKSTFQEIPFAFPPIEEQRRIVDILNRAASIERLRRQASAHLRDFIPALFLKMFGDQDEIASRYPAVMLKELAQIGSGITKGRKLKDAELVDVPYLRVANVQDGYLDLREIKTIPIRESEREKYALKVGDLVLTEGGDPDKLGRGALWEGELPYCAHQNHVFRVRPNTERVLGQYLKEVVGSAYGKAYFLSVAKQTTGIASINKTQLGEFPIPVPPMKLQAEFAKLVEAAQARARLAEKADAFAADLSHSLLWKLLETQGTTQVNSEGGEREPLAV